MKLKKIINNEIEKTKDNSIKKLLITEFNNLENCINKYYGLFEGFSKRVLEYVNTEVKYEGYIAQEEEDIAKLLKQEAIEIPEGIDFMELKGLRIEAREKLNKIRPLNVGQASRISGVSPADISVLIIYLKSLK